MKKRRFSVSDGGQDENSPKRDAKQVTPMSQEDVARLLDDRESDVSAMHPLEIYFNRDALIETVSENLQQLLSRRDPATESDVERSYVDAMLRQRMDFLSDLRQLREPTVFLAVYRPDIDDHDEAIMRDIEDLDPDEHPDLGIDRDDDLPL